MEEDNIYDCPKIPFDAEGYTVSFDIQHFNHMQLEKFYHQYGFVIFNNIINEEQAQKTIDQLWSDIQSRCGEFLNRKQRDTWKFQNWKGSYGFVSSRPLNSLQICLNRQNPKVYDAFKLTYEISAKKQLKQPLVAQFDRGSAMRPSKINKDWITSPIYHFDINPWLWTKTCAAPKRKQKMARYTPQTFEKWLSEGNFTDYVGFTKLAGVLCLSNTNQESGGFQCVPGFQHVIASWCKITQYNSPIEKDPKLVSCFQKIFQRKRSLLIFSRELPHNIYPNVSEEWRFAQYLRMSPLSTLQLTQYQQELRRKCVRVFLPKELPVDDQISKEVYMLK